MIRNFRPLRQPPGSNSCLPTAVRAVLLWHGEQASPEEVSEWCREERKGSILDLALDGLREAGFDVEELIAPTETEAQNLLRTTITDDEDAQPVIALLANPAVSEQEDHAVVVTNIRHIRTDESI